MKIAFIGQKGMPATFGGVEYHVDELSRGLAKLGHEVHVYVRNWYTNKSLKKFEGVKLIHVPTIRSKYFDASIHSFLSSFLAILKDYDVIHYHAIGPTFFSLIPKLCGRKIVSTVHRLDWKTKKWGMIARFFLKCGEYVSAQIPHQTIVVSNELRCYFKEKYNKDTKIIGHGRNLPQKRRAKLISERYDLDEREYILFMGRLSPEKRVEWLIRAYQNLKNLSKIRNIKLVIAGGSSATDNYVIELREMSKNNPEIIFPGYVAGKLKEELLSNALLFVLPSCLEGFPIVLLEAKSFGICCLASDISPHREAIKKGRTGFLFISNSLYDLENKLKLLIDNPRIIKRVGNRAREEMKRRPSWDEVAKMVIDVYQKILDSSR
jgi:glycosyltransferase involved in cell wall biosynthesis